MDFKIKKGISEKQIEQLIEYSLTDESVGKFTSDKERFKDRQAFNEWRKKGREIMVMTNDDGDLLGITWLGLKDLPERNYKIKIDPKKYKKSFAIRIYGEARGKGLAIGFMKECLKEDNVWLEVSDDNLAAKALYSKFGFRQVSEVDENGKIIMIF